MPVYKHLLPVNGAWRQDVTNWLSEDVPSFDFGGYVVGSDLKRANLYCKQDGMLCGVSFAQEVFNQCELQVEWLFEEGSFLKPSKTDSGKLVAVSYTHLDVYKRQG